MASAERDLSRLAADEIEFTLPPYDLTYLCGLHRALFRDIYEWAGEIRTVDISKDETRFCNVDRIYPEAERLFFSLRDENWLDGLSRTELVKKAAVYYGDLNVIHPFREGNGRVQRLLFEQIIINAGYQIDWWQVDKDEWLRANIDAVTCDYQSMAALFSKCIGDEIQ